MRINHYGFNFQWMVSWKPGHNPDPPDEKALDFLAEYGFNYVRIPVDYRFWTTEFDYFHPEECVFRYLDQYLEACRSRGIHMSLNLHRAPGYCTNRNDLERHNLWADEIAQNAFVFLWETFARRYQEVPGTLLSFDLVNEPPSPGEHGMTRRNHAAILQHAVAAIRMIDPDRELVIDGLGGGFLAMPELTGIGLTHSGRGYHPMPVTHHQASWWVGHVHAPAPKYPGLRWQGHTWDRAALRDSYRPWRDVERRGTRIHIGEFGCFKNTPNDVALRWFSDILSVYKEFGWGYAMWQFQGPFGIIDHGRPSARFESIGGYQVDRALLEMMLAHRIISLA